MQQEIEQQAQQTSKSAWEERRWESDKPSRGEDKVVTYRRVTYGPLKDPPGDMGGDDEVEIESKKSIVVQPSWSRAIMGEGQWRSMQCLIVGL